MKRVLVGLALLTIGLFSASCGDDDSASDDETPIADTSDDGSPDDTGTEIPLDSGPAPDVTLEEIGDPGFSEGGSGGGTATLIVGDQEWTFDGALCAFGEEMIGQEGAVFNLSATQDGLNMYASVDSFGEYVSLNDIEDQQNPSVSMQTTAEDFIEIDGKNIAAESDFRDNLTGETTPGTFTATCP